MVYQDCHSIQHPTTYLRYDVDGQEKIVITDGTTQVTKGKPKTNCNHKEDVFIQVKYYFRWVREDRHMYQRMNMFRNTSLAFSIKISKW